MPNRRIIRVKETKNAFSYIPASNLGGRLEELQEIFKSEDQSQNQMSHRKAMKANKKYSKFFQIN